MDILLKRGNTAANNSYTGPSGTVTIDTQLLQLRVHDGTTLGGTIVGAASDAATLGGYPASYFLNASNLSTGILPTARLSGTYPISVSGSAATLTTPRTINGTAFNGTSNIVTSYWGTSRTFTVGEASASVNGSANVSISLSQMGAASRDITLEAGAGLTGGGVLTWNRSFALGTPSTLTGTTVNSSSGTTHTHNITNTSTRTTNSTSTLLNAKAMYDHVQSGDHDSRYMDLGITNTSNSSIGWHTIAQATGRAYGEFTIRDATTGAHNFVKLTAATSFGYASTTVISGTRPGATSSVYAVRVLYNASDRANGLVKLQVFIEQASVDVTVTAERTAQYANWASWVPVALTPENIPFGYAEEPNSRLDDITNPGQFISPRRLKGDYDTQGALAVNSLASGQAVMTDSGTAALRLHRPISDNNVPIRYSGAATDMYAGMAAAGEFGIGATSDLISSGFCRISASRATFDGRVITNTSDDGVAFLQVGGAARITGSMDISGDVQIRSGAGLTFGSQGAGMNTKGRIDFNETSNAFEFNFT